MTARAVRRVLVYGDANLNATDGSAIWVQSTVEVFARTGCQVVTLLRTPVETRRHLEPLEALPGVTIIRPYEDGLVPRGSGDRLTVAQASALMRDLDRQERFDVVVLRGYDLVCRVVDDGGFEGRLWTYLTDIPQSVAAMDPERADRLRDIALASRFVLCQTDELRAFLEATVPAACGRSVLFSPIVPTPTFAIPPARTQPAVPLKLVYSGKFAPLWNTLAMTDLPAQLAGRGIAAELHAIGDKVEHDPDDLPFRARMLKALRSTPGVIWHGGQSRQDAMRLAAEGDIGLGWRDRAMEASLELSTKILEYGSVGLPVVLNRTPMHEALLGVDYPLFARTAEDVVAAVAYVAQHPASYAEAAARCAGAAARFALPKASRQVAELLDTAFPAAPDLEHRGRPLRVAVAGHDLKFFGRILEHLGAAPGIEVRLDRWPDLAVHDEAASRAMVDWADVVICEWFGPNALWYSANRRPDQRLIVHLHRFELYRPWPGQADIERIDQVVCVSPHYARIALQRTGWPGSKVTVIANYVDDAQLDRPKLEGARFHLGMIGIAPALKRMDLALDVLALLRRDDPRYQLFAKTKLPWEYPWIWSVPTERVAFEEILRRVQLEPALRGAVTFDAFGPDVPAWLRRIGWVLSTSDGESFHLAPADGMASRAVPVVRDWPGADTIYDQRWIRHDPAAMAQLIATIAAEDRWEAEGERACTEVRERYGLRRVAEAWTRILEANLPGTEVDPAAPPAVDAFAEPVRPGPATL
jgi:glycosyltransferase involved in cell wall biosynthesis